MRFGAAIMSFVLHLCVALLVYFGVPTFFEPDFDVAHTIPVEIVTIADITNPPPPQPAPKPEPDEKVDIPPPPDPLPEVEPVPPPPEPEALPQPAPPEPAPKPAVVEAPPPPPPVPEKEPEVVEPPPPSPEPVVVPPPSAKPERVAALDIDALPAPPTSKPEPPAKKQQFDTLLKDLTKSAPAPKTPAPAVEQAAAEPTPAPSTVTSARDEPLSKTVSDSIRRQVEEKWNVPAGARDAGALEVEIYIVLLPDGTVSKAEIIDKARMLQPGGEFYRAMAESARRAVLQASPLRDLPPDRYEDWREITFRFRPPV